MKKCYQLPILNTNHIKVIDALDFSKKKIILSLSTATTWHAAKFVLPAVVTNISTLKYIKKRKWSFKHNLGEGEGEEEDTDDRDQNSYSKDYWRQVPNYKESILDAHIEIHQEL